jgi:hypothetical protein
MMMEPPVCYKYPAVAAKATGRSLIGGIAQLGERRVRIAEARGSSPLTSTSRSMVLCAG